MQNITVYPNRDVAQSMAQRVSVVAVFGTRPEIIKFSPVLQALDQEPNLQVVRLPTGQQADLVPDFLHDFNVTIDESLGLMSPNQSLNQLLANSIGALDEAIKAYDPVAVIVQGDTTTALAAALSARFLRIPVIHIEAGLRSGDINSPFPEEANRKLITQISSLHLAPTQHNVKTLLNEGVSPEAIVLTGNPIVEVLNSDLAKAEPSADFKHVLDELADFRIVAVTLHRRENFGQRLDGYLSEIAQFVAGNPDVALVIPVHPNPTVQSSVTSAFTSNERVKLLKPLSYVNFLSLLTRAWLILSDSGGVQEEVATLGKPLLILRENTERPEVIESGYARLARTPAELRNALGDANHGDSWCTELMPGRNPFGEHDSGVRIAAAINSFLFDKLERRSK